MCHLFGIRSLQGVAASDNPSRFVSRVKTNYRQNVRATSRFSVRFFAGDRIITTLIKAHLLWLMELSKHQKFRGRESLMYYFYV
jgi:hypothetical protein